MYCIRVIQVPKLPYELTPTLYSFDVGAKLCICCCCYHLSEIDVLTLLNIFIMLYCSLQFLNLLILSLRNKFSIHMKLMFLKIAWNLKKYIFLLILCRISFSLSLSLKNSVVNNFVLYFGINP